MPTRPLPLELHLRIEELEQRYHGCKDAKEKTRWQSIWLYTQQEKPSTLAVSRASGFSQNWVYKLIWRYNAEGPVGLVDKHRDNPGGISGLS